MISPADILQAKILIVDDQQANVTLLEKLLEGAGYTRVSSTLDSERVCELHLSQRYDLILLDLAMPGMDGFQVMENLKQLEPEGYLPVLVLTAQPDHKLRALKAGARDFVSKPFDLAEVLLRVHNLVEVRLMHQQLKQLYERVLSEQKVSARLALAASMAAVAPGPRASNPVGEGLVTGSYAELTALFADLADFNRQAPGASASVLASVLDAVSSRAANAPAARKELLGDAYLAAAGLSEPLAQRSIAAATRAIDLNDAVARFNAHADFRINVRIRVEPGERRRSSSKSGKKKALAGR